MHMALLVNELTDLLSGSSMEGLLERQAEDLDMHMALHVNRFTNLLSGSSVEGLL